MEPRDPTQVNLISEPPSDRSQLDNFVSSLHSFEPESVKDRQSQQDLINSAAQYDNMDSLLEFLMDEPQNKQVSQESDLRASQPTSRPGHDLAPDG